MADPNKKYRMQLNGEEIEKLLRSVSDKLNANAITKDINSTSDSEVLAASVANEQLKILRDRTTGEGVKKMLELATDVHPLTTALLNKINSLELVFIGSMGATSRDALDTTLFKGGEVLLLLNSNDSGGLLQYWDRTTKKWITASILEGYRNVATALTAGVASVQTFDKNSFRTATFTVSVRSSNEFHVTHYNMGWTDTDTFITSYGDVRNGDVLYTLATSISASGVDVTATTAKNNTRLQIEVHSVY